MVNFVHPKVLEAVLAFDPERDRPDIITGGVDAESALGQLVDHSRGLMAIRGIKDIAKLGQDVAQELRFEPRFEDVHVQSAASLSFETAARYLHSLGWLDWDEAGEFRFGEKSPLGSATIPPAISREPLVGETFSVNLSTEKPLATLPIRLTEAHNKIIELKLWDFHGVYVIIEDTGLLPSCLVKPESRHRVRQIFALWPRPVDGPYGWKPLTSKLGLLCHVCGQEGQADPITVVGSGSAMTLQFSGDENLASTTSVSERRAAGIGLARQWGYREQALLRRYKLSARGGGVEGIVELASPETTPAGMGGDRLGATQIFAYVELAQNRCILFSVGTMFFFLEHQKSSPLLMMHCLPKGAIAELLGQFRLHRDVQQEGLQGLEAKTREILETRTLGKFLYARHSLAIVINLPDQQAGVYLPPRDEFENDLDWLHQARLDQPSLDQASLDQPQAGADVAMAIFPLQFVREDEETRTRWYRYGQHLGRAVGDEFILEDGVVLKRSGPRFYLFPLSARRGLRGEELTSLRLQHTRPGQDRLEGAKISLPAPAESALAESAPTQSDAPSADEPQRYVLSKIEGGSTTSIDNRTVISYQAGPFVIAVEEDKTFTTPHRVIFLFESSLTPDILRGNLSKRGHIKAWRSVWLEESGLGTNKFIPLAEMNERIIEQLAEYYQSSHPMQVRLFKEHLKTPIHGVAVQLLGPELEGAVLTLRPNEALNKRLGLPPLPKTPAPPTSPSPLQVTYPFEDLQEVTPGRKILRAGPVLVVINVTSDNVLERMPLVVNARVAQRYFLGEISAHELGRPDRDNPGVLLLGLLEDTDYLHPVSSMAPDRLKQLADRMKTNRVMQGLVPSLEAQSRLPKDGLRFDFSMGERPSSLTITYYPEIVDYLKLPEAPEAMKELVYPITALGQALIDKSAGIEKYFYRAGPFLITYYPSDNPTFDVSDYGQAELVEGFDSETFKNYVLSKQNLSARERLQLGSPEANLFIPDASFAKPETLRKLGRARETRDFQNILGQVAFPRGALHIVTEGASVPKTLHIRPTKAVREFLHMPEAIVVEGKAVTQSQQGTEPLSIQVTYPVEILETEKIASAVISFMRAGPVVVVYSEMIPYASVLNMQDARNYLSGGKQTFGATLSRQALLIRRGTDDPHHFYPLASMSAVELAAFIEGCSRSAAMADFRASLPLQGSLPPEGLVFELDAQGKPKTLTINYHPKLVEYLGLPEPAESVPETVYQIVSLATGLIDKKTGAPEYYYRAGPFLITFSIIQGDPTFFVSEYGLADIVADSSRTRFDHYQRSHETLDARTRLQLASRVKNLFIPEASFSDPRKLRKLSDRRSPNIKFFLEQISFPHAGLYLATNDDLVPQTLHIRPTREVQKFLRIPEEKPAVIKSPPAPLFQRGGIESERTAPVPTYKIGPALIENSDHSALQALGAELSADPVQWLREQTLVIEAGGVENISYWALELERLRHQGVDIKPAEINFEIKLGQSAYPAGTLFSLGEQATIALSREDTSRLTDGDTVTIKVGGDQRLYTLQKIKGQRFHLLEEGETVDSGTGKLFLRSGGGLRIELAGGFIAEGDVPRREQATGLIIRGVGKALFGAVLEHFVGGHFTWAQALAQRVSQQRFGGIETLLVGTGLKVKIPSGENETWEMEVQVSTRNGPTLNGPPSPCGRELEGGVILQWHERPPHPPFGHPLPRGERGGNEDGEFFMEGDALHALLQAGARARSEIYLRDMLASTRKNIAFDQTDSDPVFTAQAVEVLFPDSRARIVLDLKTRALHGEVIAAQFHLGAEAITLSQQKWAWGTEEDPGNETTLNWKAVTAKPISTPRGKLEVKRNLEVTLVRHWNNAGRNYDYLGEGRWREFRDYTLSGGDKFSVVVDVRPNGLSGPSVAIVSASWQSGGRRVALRWSEHAGLYEFTNQNEAENLRDLVLLRVPVSLKAETTVFSTPPNVMSTQQISLPLETPRGVTLKRSINLAHEIRADGSSRLHAMKYEVNGKSVSLGSGGQQSFEVLDEFSAGGQEFMLEDVITLTHQEGAWQAQGRVQAIRQGDLLIWGYAVSGGFYVNYLWKTPSPIPLALGLVREGEIKIIEVAGAEYLLTFKDNNFSLVPLNLPTLPQHLVALGEDEALFLNPELFSEAVDLRAGRISDDLPLPFARDVRELQAQNVIDLLHSMPEAELFFPTAETMNKMIAEAGKARLLSHYKVGTPVLLQFVGSHSQLLLEAEFVYHKGEGTKWRIAQLSKNKEVSLRFNGNGPHPARYQRWSADLQEFQPIPPGSTRLYTSHMGGLAGFFVFYNSATDATSDLTPKDKRARLGFSRYLHALGAGFLEGVNRRFVGRMEYELRDDTTLVTSLTEEEKSDSGPRATGRRLSFSAELDPINGTISFPKGRSLINIFFEEVAKQVPLPQGGVRGGGFDDRKLLNEGRGSSDETVQSETTALFQVCRFQWDQSRGRMELIFIPMTPSASKAFRATFLPGAEPVFIEIAVAELTESLAPAPPAWLFSENWVSDLVAIKAKREERVVRPQLGRLEPYQPHPEVLVGSGSRRIEIQGVSRQAGLDLLPYQTHQRGRRFQTIGRLSEANAGQWVDVMEEWLSGGGSDFQLLPESVLFLAAQQKALAARLAQIRQGLENPHKLFDRWTSAVKDWEAVHLWFMNGRSVRLRLSLVPLVSGDGKAAKVFWVVDRDGKKAEGREIIVEGPLGEGPTDGDWLRLIIPVIYQRAQYQVETLDLFDPSTRLRGLTQKLKVLSLGPQGFSRGIGLTDLPALYDSTSRQGEEKNSGRIFTSRAQSLHMARNRLARLHSLIEEAKEIYVVQGEPLLQGTQYQWTLVEREDSGAGVETGMQIRLSYSLPHREDTTTVYSAIPIPLADEMELELGFVFGEGSPQWQKVLFLCYQNGAEVVLVQKDNPKQRFILSFDPSRARAGTPSIRKIREFESAGAVQAFYAPKKWEIIFNVRRVRSLAPTTGVGRVADVTSEYTDTLELAPGHQVHRYSLSVDDAGLIATDHHFDVELSAEGEIVRVFPRAWALETKGESTLLDADMIQAELASPTDLRRVMQTRLFEEPSYEIEGELLSGDVFVFLDHRPPQDVGKARTHNLVVGLQKNPATGNFLGTGVSVSYFMYRREPANPARTFPPSLARNQFHYQLVEHGEPNEGYLRSQQINPDSWELEFIFYAKGAQARDRKRLYFALQKSGDGAYFVVPKSLCYEHYKTGERISTLDMASLDVVQESSPATRYRLTTWPICFEFELDENMNVVAGGRNIFTLNHYRSWTRFMTEKSLGLISTEHIERGQEIFAETYGISVRYFGILPAHLDTTLPGQVWLTAHRHSKEAGQLYGSVGIEYGLRSIWLEACILSVQAASRGTALADARKGSQVEEGSAKDISELASRLLRNTLYGEDDRMQSRGPSRQSDRFDKPQDKNANEAARQAQANAGSALEDFDQFVATLVNSSDEEENDLGLTLLEADSIDTLAVRAAMPVDWDTAKQLRLLELLERKLAPFIPTSAINVPTPATLYQFYEQSLKNFVVDEEDYPDFNENFRKHHHRLLQSGFGFSLLAGLKTYAELTHNQEESQADFDALTVSLMLAAFSVFEESNATKQEADAALLAEALLPAELARGMEAPIREELLDVIANAALSSVEAKRRFCLQLAPFLPYVENPKAQSRLIHVLARGKWPEDGGLLKNVLRQAVEKAHIEARRKVEPIAAKVKQILGIRRWMELMTEPEPSEPTTKTMLGSSGVVPAKAGIQLSQNASKSGSPIKALGEDFGKALGADRSTRKIPLSRSLSLEVQTKSPLPLRERARERGYTRAHPPTNFRLQRTVRHTSLTRLRHQQLLAKR